MDILSMNINEMNRLDFDCACGRHHSMLKIRHIAVGENTLRQVADIAEPFKGRTVFLYGDQNTRKAAGIKTLGILEGAGFAVKSFFFDSGESILIPDEKAIGRLFMELDDSVGFIVGVGSGTINDMGKYLSARTGIPFCIVGTAPSMDGYASDTSPLMCAGYKISYQSVLPYAIVGDLDILSAAPDKLVHAGVGDVIGKLTALAEWLLSKEMTGEYYCETCVDLVRQALDKVESGIGGIRNREKAAMGFLMEALILTGVAMGLIGVSRPASGGEHQMSHFWEMDFIARGLYPELHGIKVGVSTPIVAELFEMMGDALPQSVRDIMPTRGHVEGILSAVGAPIHPKDLGIDRKLFRDCLMEAHKTRDRYSIFRFALERGLLEDCADTITARLYD